MDSYLSTAVLDSESNPLDWWSVEHRNYPILAQLAKKYLCTCASSAASESYSVPQVMLSLQKGVA